MTNSVEPAASSHAPNILTAHSVTKTVATTDGELTLLSDISFSIQASDSLAIVGASGSGKSTLLSLLAGLDLPSSGEISLCNQRLDQLGEDGRAAIRGAHVGFVFQSFQLLPNLTALENTLLPLEVLGCRDGAEYARNLLDRVGLSHRLQHYPRQLSGGEQQRVAIARAFISEPDILFADEPTGNLDTATGHKIIDLLFDLNQQLKTTLVLVTHDSSLANRCDQILTLSGGKQLKVGEKGE